MLESRSQYDRPHTVSDKSHFWLYLCYIYLLEETLYFFSCFYSHQLNAFTHIVPVRFKHQGLYSLVWKPDHVNQIGKVDRKNLKSMCKNKISLLLSYLLVQYAYHNCVASHHVLFIQIIHISEDQRILDSQSFFKLVFDLLFIKELTFKNMIWEVISWS